MNLSPRKRSRCRTSACATGTSKEAALTRELYPNASRPLTEREPTAAENWRSFTDEERKWVSTWIESYRQIMSVHSESEYPQAAKSARRANHVADTALAILVDAAKERP